MPKKNAKLRKIIVVVITTCCVLYAGVFAISKIYLDPKEIKSILVSKLEASLNRKITLSDDLSLGISWNMSPYIELNDLTIGNANWSQPANMLSVEKLDLKLSIWPLLFKKVQIDSLILKKPNVYLESNNNQRNWTFENPVGAGLSTGPAPDPGISIEIKEIIVLDGMLSYKDKGRAARAVKITKLVLINDDPRLKLKYIDLNVGTSNLSGNLNINKKNFSVDGSLESNLLNISDLTGGGSNSAGGEYSIPSTELPIDKLKDADIDVTLKVKKLDLGKIVLTGVKLIAETKNQVLRIALDPAAGLFNGNLDLDMAYDLKPKTPSFTFNMKTSPIKLDHFAPINGSSMELKSNLTGSGSNLNSIVNSLSGKILATASPGSYRNSSSEFTNAIATILSSAITFEKTKSSTDFQCAVVNMQVNNGVAATNKGIALEAATVDVTGSGTVDLRNGRLSLAINPQNVGNSMLNMSQFSMAQLINVSGTISNPVINLNPIGLIAGAAMSKTVLSSIAGGLPGGLASIASSMGMGSKKPETNNTAAANAHSEVCKKALAL